MALVWLQLPGTLLAASPLPEMAELDNHLDSPQLLSPVAGKNQGVTITLTSWQGRVLVPAVALIQKQTNKNKKTKPGQGFNMGATEVLSRAIPLFKDTLSFAEGFTYMKMQLP